MFVDDLVHDHAKADPLIAARHSAFIATHLVVGVVTLACLPGYLALRGDLTPTEALVFSILACPVAIAFFLSRTARFEAANILSAMALCGLVAVAATRTGGVQSFVLICLPLVPLEAAIAGSRRVVAAALAMAVLTAAGIAGADMAGLLPSAAETANSMALHGVVMMAAIGYAGGIAFLNHGFQAAEAEMIRSGEARYAMLAENMNDLVTRHGEAGRVTYASPAATVMTGVAPSALLGQGLFERVHVSDRPTYLAALSQAQAGAACTAEFRLRRDGGISFIWVEMRCRSVGAGEASHVVAVSRDITGRKAQELATEAARAEAERANAAKGRFLATMSHELRTPLNAVIGFSEMLMNEKVMGIDAERRHEYAGLIHDSGQHLLSVVNGVLDMSKIETGNFQILAEPFSIESLVDNCRAMMLLKAEAGRIRLDLAVEPGLPDIVADKRACRQICLNLMSNAIKFTPPGGKVTVGARAEAAGIALFVTDTGVGIAREDLPRLGEAFFQASSAYDRAFEGTGLGLSVVKGLAVLHGGWMEVDSVVGRGTTVTVRLPLDCENAASRDAIAMASNVERLWPRAQQPGPMSVPETQGKKRA
ncbi:PAS domain-containing sensor histidine kinase [Labrys wisconsinensis]|uniref:histidine kinase n=1 Tax=Labrys wisconsinensis TaxID=425677 RepID=A0ABU0J856_9HYPH|nr:PAS domain-containing sensor histidine kinase [Labrys wisconsinensis]MDQ0469711.1 cell cycle sensor histidine kinase DivJ [Labrys wisconsinensis]